MTDTVWCGTDPGTRHIGVMWLKQADLRWEYVWGTTITTGVKDTMDERLAQVFDAIRYTEFMGYPTPVRFVVEAQEGARIGARKRGETNYHVDKIERVIGMVWLYAKQMSVCGVPLIEVTPGFQRKCLGLSNKAKKDAMHKMLRKIVVGIPREAKEHELDAGCIAIAGERRYQVDETIERVRSARQQHAEGDA